MFSKLLNFFSTQAGKEKIQAGKLSQTELFIYFYLILLFDYLGSTQQALNMIGKTPRILDYLNIWTNPVLGIIGLILLFLANGGSKGHDFLSKYFTFSFTVGIKYYILYIFLEYLPTDFPALTSNYYEIPITVLINVIMLANIGLRIYQTKT